MTSITNQGDLNYQSSTDASARTEDSNQEHVSSEGLQTQHQDSSICASKRSQPTHAMPFQKIGSTEEGSDVTARRRGHRDSTKSLSLCNGLVENVNAALVGPAGDAIRREAGSSLSINQSSVNKSVSSLSSGVPVHHPVSALLTHTAHFRHVSAP